MMPLTLVVTEADIAQHAAKYGGEAAVACLSYLDTRERALDERERAIEAKERDLAARMQAMADVIMRSAYGVPSRPSLESFSPLMAKGGTTGVV
jgi:hypothetical protein